MRFPRQEYLSGLPFPSPEDLPDPGIEPRIPALQADSLSTELQGKPHLTHQLLYFSYLVNIRLCNPDIHMNSLGTKDLQMSHDAKKGQNMGQNLGESSLYIVCRTTFWHAGHVGPVSTRAINICKSYFLQMIESVEFLEVEWLIHPFIPQACAGSLLSSRCWEWAEAMRLNNVVLAFEKCMVQPSVQKDRQSCCWCKYHWLMLEPVQGGTDISHES